MRILQKTTEDKPKSDSDRQAAVIKLCRGKDGGWTVKKYMFIKKTRGFINKYGIFWGLCLLAERISIYLFTCLRSEQNNILLLTFKFHYYEQSSINRCNCC
jgi:hypothetical protein